MSYLNQFVRQCHSNILNKGSSEIRAALDYLHKRKITDSTIEKHLIGYCPSLQNVPNEICFYGKNCISYNGNGQGFSSFIKGRVIVPIYSEFNILEGFATRTPSFEAGNSWWNISKPFHKGNHLFLLNTARKSIFDKNKVYLVEGYMDALYLSQEGLDNVVSIMGIYLTPRKVSLVARYCNNICICLDVDKNQSGQKAQNKIIAILNKFGFYESISVIDGIPEGEDPDEFVAKNGIDVFLGKERKLTESEITKISKEVKEASKKRD